MVGAIAVPNQRPQCILPGLVYCTCYLHNNYLHPDHDDPGITDYIHHQIDKIITDSYNTLNCITSISNAFIHTWFFPLNIILAYK